MVTLTVTMIIEIPVLLMVLGGSDRLHNEIGRSSYQLLMGLLPLSCAISGNVGLQASAMTTRAVVHGRVTPDSFRSWLLKEVAAASLLGCGMGVLLFVVTFWASSYNYPLAFSVATGQLISIATAGCTGAISPILSRLLFGRDSGKWESLTLTVVQDVIAAFAMIFLTIYILKLFGPLDDAPL